ncbi:MAG: hypothetical protein IT462_12745 [Planctomycetes bacterium]|nr:hypothetical protein [Planctomycetota bacterium]
MPSNERFMDVLFEEAVQEIPAPDLFEATLARANPAQRPPEVVREAVIHRLRLRWWVMAEAAAVVIVAGLVAYLVWAPKPVDKPGEPDKSWLRIVVPEAGEKQLAVEDAFSQQDFGGSWSPRTTAVAHGKTALFVVSKDGVDSLWRADGLELKPVSWVGGQWVAGSHLRFLAGNDPAYFEYRAGASAAVELLGVYRGVAMVVENKTGESFTSFGERPCSAPDGGWYFAARTQSTSEMTLAMVVENRLTLPLGDNGKPFRTTSFTVGLYTDGRRMLTPEPYLDSLWFVRGSKVEEFGIRHINEVEPPEGSIRGREVEFLQLPDCNLVMDTDGNIWRVKDGKSEWIVTEKGDRLVIDPSLPTFSDGHVYMTSAPSKESRIYRLEGTTAVEIEWKGNWPRGSVRLDWMTHFISVYAKVDGKQQYVLGVLGPDGAWPVMTEAGKLTFLNEPSIDQPYLENYNLDGRWFVRYTVDGDWRWGEVAGTTLYPLEFPGNTPSARKDFVLIENFGVLMADLAPRAGGDSPPVSHNLGWFDADGKFVPFRDNFDQAPMTPFSAVASCEGAIYVIAAESADGPVRVQRISAR